MRKDLVDSKKSSTFALAYQKWYQKTLQGVLTERLGNGLQNRVERFDSARHLESFIKHLLDVCKQKTLQGVLTERLGNGLQNRVERFDSARHLAKRKSFKKGFLFCFLYLPYWIPFKAFS